MAGLRKGEGEGGVGQTVLSCEPNGLRLDIVNLNVELRQNYNVATLKYKKTQKLNCQK